jgi:hypothetical protein
MGRYANFNTGFEYKFSFGGQSSYDIQEFGGEISGEKVNGYDIDMEHKWTQEDKKNPSLELIASEIDFNKYEKNLEGTQKLAWDLYVLSLDHTYILGCLIYHQLLYTDVLTCSYETN